MSQCVPSVFPVCSLCDVCWPGQVVSPALRLQHSGQSQPCPAPGGLHPAAGLEMSENTKQHLLLLSQGRAVSEQHVIIFVNNLFVSDLIQEMALPAVWSRTGSVRTSLPGSGEEAESEI